MTDIEKRLVVAKGEGVAGGMEWEPGVSRCKLLYMWIKNKILLYSTENYIQYFAIIYNRKETEKIYFRLVQKCGFYIAEIRHLILEYILK